MNAYTRDLKSIRRRLRSAQKAFIRGMDGVLPIANMVPASVIACRAVVDAADMGLPTWPTALWWIDVLRGRAKPSRGRERRLVVDGQSYVIRSVRMGGHRGLKHKETLRVFWQTIVAPGIVAWADRYQSTQYPFHDGLEILPQKEAAIRIREAIRRTPPGSPMRVLALWLYATDVVIQTVEARLKCPGCPAKRLKRKELIRWINKQMPPMRLLSRKRLTATAWAKQLSKMIGQTVRPDVVRATEVWREWKHIDFRGRVRPRGYPPADNLIEQVMFERLERAACHRKKMPKRRSRGKEIEDYDASPFDQTWELGDILWNIRERRHESKS